MGLFSSLKAPRVSIEQASLSVLNQVVDSWHPAGTAFLGMHTQSLASLPALMGMKSVTNCILLLVSLLCPPAPWLQEKRVRSRPPPQGEGGDKRVLGCVAKGLL